MKSIVLIQQPGFFFVQVYRDKFYIRKLQGKVKAIIVNGFEKRTLKIPGPNVKEDIKKCK